MTTTVRAIYQGGVFRPAEPLPLADGAAVDLTIAPPAPAVPDAIERRIREARTLQELWDAMDAAAVEEPDDGYDLLEALNRNRLEAGERPLLPVTDGGAP